MQFSKDKLFIRIRYFGYLLLGTFDKIFGRKCKVFVLCYHSISNDNWRFSVKPSIFEKQLDYLNRHYQNISAEELKEYLEGKVDLKKPSYLLTFDDGYKNLLSIRKYLKKKNIRPIIFVLINSSKIDRASLGTRREILSVDDIKKLINDGWDIGYHTATHPGSLSKLNFNILIKEIVKSKVNLEKELGISIKYFSYPQGSYNDRLIEIVKNSGFQMAFTMDSGCIQRRSNTFTLPREGVDGSHTLKEFENLFSPSVIILKNIIKKIIKN